MAFAPDGQTLASGYGDGTIKLWRIRDGACLRTFRRTIIAQVSLVVFSPDGQTLAASYYNNIKLWRVSDGTYLQTLEPIYGISSMAFSPDGKTLAVGDLVGAITFWCVRDLVILQPLTEQKGTVFSMAFAPDGQTLAASMGDTIILWRVCDSVCLQTLRGAGGPVAFAADGQTLAGYADHSIKVWRVRDGVCLRTIAQIEGIFPGGFVLSPDWQMLALGSRGDVTLWSLPPHEGVVL